MSARTIALRALREWRRKQRFADSIIQELVGRESLRESDRAFARELFYGVLRNLRLLDFWIGLLRKGKLDETSRDILRLGLYQLFLLRTPEHAAVHETVSLADRNRRSLINAVLRSAQRAEEKLSAQAEAAPLGIRFSNPDFLIARWQKNFGLTATAKLAALNNQPALVYARINRLKIQPGEFLSVYPQSNRVPNHPDFVQMTHLPSDALAAGLFYIQDPSTVVACEMLESQPNERILDACAAPGGKTALLAQLMNNRGAIIACDRDAERLARLQENLDRLGIEIATVRQHDWTQNAGQTQDAEFDRILVDASCSNTGVVRRRVDVRWRLDPDEFARMQKRQLGIIRNVVPLLKLDGILVYSTCSLEPEENEQVAVQVLKEFRNLKLIEQRMVTPFADGFDGAFAAKFIRTR
jgi:16S rRNA (cytosine967-C5)-methyltransferase